MSTYLGYVAILSAKATCGFIWTKTAHYRSRCVRNTLARGAFVDHADEENPRALLRDAFHRSRLQCRPTGPQPYTFFATGSSPPRSTAEVSPRFVCCLPAEKEDRECKKCKRTRCCFLPPVYINRVKNHDDVGEGIMHSSGGWLLWVIIPAQIMSSLDLANPLPASSHFSVPPPPLPPSTCALVTAGLSDAAWAPRAPPSRPPTPPPQTEPTPTKGACKRRERGLSIERDGLCMGKDRGRDSQRG